MTGKFEVTKEWLEEKIGLGMPVVSIAEKLSELAGRKCSTNNVKAICKYYGINLRKKPNSFFIPVVQEKVAVNDSVVPTTPGGIVENVVVTDDMKNTYPDAFEQHEVGSIVTVETVTDEAIINETIDSFIEGK